VKLTTAIVGFVLFGLTGCGSPSEKPQKSVPTIYIIDSGRTGWVKIVYNRQDEKELPVENGFAVAHVGQDLKLFTRSRMNQSWDGAQFYYQAPDGKRVRLSSADNGSRLIWGMDKTSGDGGEREAFFVGSQDEMSEHLKSQQMLGGGLVTPPTDPEKSGTAAQRDARDVVNELPK
jgi:hypothetical protein